MEAAGSMAVTKAEGAAAQALKALAHPSWTPAVVATAAAMAADSTASACARSFVEQVASKWKTRKEGCALAKEMEADFT